MFRPQSLLDLNIKLPSGLDQIVQGAIDKVYWTGFREGLLVGLCGVILTGLFFVIRSKKNA